MIKVPGTAAGVPGGPAPARRRASTSTSRCCSRARPTPRSPRRTSRRSRSGSSAGCRSTASPRVASFFVSRIDTLVDRRLEEQIAAAADASDARTPAGAARPGRDRQRQARLPPLRDARRRARAGAAGGGRRAPAAPALGVDLDQEPGLPRHALRRGADRSRHGEHDAARDDRGVPRPRRGAHDARRAASTRRERRPGRARRAPASRSTRATDELLADGVAKFVEPFEQAARGGGRARRASSSGPRGVSAPASRVELDGRRRAAGRRAGGTSEAPRAGSSPATRRSGPAAARNRLARLARRARGGARPPRALDAMRAPRSRPEASGHVAAARHGRLEPRARGPARRSFGRAPARPSSASSTRSTPTQIARRRAPASTWRRTLVVVASKSGSTLEPNLLLAHFWRAIGARASARPSAGRRFVAITDPGSKLEALARERGFRRSRRRASRRSAAASRRCRRSAWCRPRCRGIDVEALAARRAETMAIACRRRRRRPEPGRRRSALLLGAGRGTRPRQADARRRARARALRRLARAADRRVDRQAGRAILPIDGEPLVARRSATATTACSSRCASTAHLAPGDDQRLAALAAARPAGGRARPRRSARPRRRVLPLGDRDRGRRRRCSASTRSTSPTSRRPRSRRAS